MPRSTRSHLRYALAIALALLGVAASAPAASAATVTLTVDSLADSEGGSCSPTTGCTLREAINLVAEGEEDEGDIGGDVIVDFDVTGTIEIEDEFELWLGVGVESLSILGPGAGSLTIDAQEESRVFSYGDGTGSLRIAGLTVENGYVGGIAVDGDGGAALYQSNGEATLEEVHFTHNHIESNRDGGAIDVEAGNLKIVDSTIDHNTTDADLEGSGGGINIDSSGSTVTLLGTEVANNYADGNGGGIYLDEGSLEVSEDSRIVENEAAVSGGGLYVEPNGSHTAKISGSTVAGNKAAEFGGAIVTNTGSGGLHIEESTISGNTAAEGGGLRVEGPTTIETSTLSENEATGSGSSGGAILVIEDTLLLDRTTLAKNVGGAIFASDGETQIHASTIAANPNPGGDAGGIFANEDVTIKVRSSIVAENTGEGGGPADCAAEVVSEGHNILGTEDAGCVWPQGEGDQLGASPLLGALADNGGPTETMAPTSAASPAINHGGNPDAHDQRGFERPVPIGEPAKTDVGAVEVQAPVSLGKPTVSANPGMVEGAVLTCDKGNWLNDTVTNPTYTYTWLADSVAIGSESTYELKADDAGKDIVCRVSDNNGVVKVEEASNPVELPPGTLSLSPTSYNFGSRNANSGPSAPKSFTVKNEGGTVVNEIAFFTTDDITFPVTPSACTNASLGPGEECTIDILFQPRNTGVLTANLNVTSDIPTVSASLEGAGTQGAVAILPTAFDFGSRRTDSGASAAKVFEVESAGTGPVTIGTASIAASTEFAIVAESDECAGETLEPGEKCTVEVVFDPSTTGAKTGFLAVPSDIPTATASLSGTATAPAVSISPTSFDFGSQPVGSGPSGAKTFEVTSTGTAPVTVGTASIVASTEFTIPADGDECAGETLDPGEMCTVEAVFDPSASGEQTAILSVPSEVPNVTAQLSGTGTVPGFAANPAALDFGSHQVGSEEVRTVTISNPGGAPASIDSVEITGAAAFALPAGGDECSGEELAPSATCTIEVGFTPAAAGGASASLDIDGDAPGTVALSGTGVAKPAPPAPAPPSASLLGAGPFAGNAGGAVPLTVVCTSPGGAPCQTTVALSAGGAALGSWSGSLAPGTNQTAEVPLSAAARKQLGAKGKLAAEALLSVAGGNGATVPLTLLAPKAPTLKLKSAKRIGDSVDFKLSCGGYAARCKGTLTLTAGATKLASGKVSLAKGSGERVLALTAAGRRLLQEDPQIQLLVKLTAKDPVYQRTTTVTKKLRLAGP